MKLLTKSLLAVLLVAGAAYTYASPKSTFIQQKTEDRHLSGFHAIEVGGPYDVTVTQGNTESVELEAPKTLLPMLPPKWKTVC